LSDMTTKPSSSFPVTTTATTNITNEKPLNNSEISIFRKCSSSRLKIFNFFFF
jgi:hypothetical protein